MLQPSLAHRISAIRNTAEVIAHSLKEMIHEAELKPGQPLIQERIAEMFQVSRVPVRDALQMLISTGIAVSVPRHGVIVRPLSRRSIEDLFEVRKILEGPAIRMAVRNSTPEHRRRLERIIAEQGECVQTGDVKRNARLDDLFHRTLFEAVGNARLVELIFANWEMIKQARSASTVMPAHGRAWIATSVKRHRRLQAALKKRDASAVATVVFENIDGSQREIISCLAEMAWIDAAADPPLGEGGRR